MTGEIVVEKIKSFMDLLEYCFNFPKIVSNLDVATTEALSTENTAMKKESNE